MKGIIKKLFICPVKSLSFNKINKIKVIKNIGFKDDRNFAFTRGLNKKISKEYVNSYKKRNLNNFLTLRNAPFLKKYNFVYNEEQNTIIVNLRNKKIFK